jgi:hypothetical protein
MSTRRQRFALVLAVQTLALRAAAQAGLPASPPSEAAPPAVDAAPAPAPVPAPADAVAPPPAPDAAAGPAPAGAAPAPAADAGLPELPIGETAASASGDGGFALGGDGSLELDEGAKLELYGFADFNYTHTFGGKDNEWRQFVTEYPSMYVGHINLYLSSKLSSNWRSLAEVRFTYAPLGNESKTNPDGTFQTTDTAAADYAEIQRTINWSGIEVQRVWLEYQPWAFLTIRAGQWLTPYGYWNDDHGSPAIVGVHKPYAINDQLFPERQTGVEAYGKLFIDSTAIGYFVTLSNGRGPFDAIRDLDANKAIGGRLFVESSALGDLTVGVNAYKGRYTTSTKQYDVGVDEAGQPKVVINRKIDASYRELSLGVDARFLWQGLHVQAELMMNEAAFDDENRPRTVGFDQRPAFVADYRRIGGYALVGYRLPWLTLMPYGVMQHLSFTNADAVGPVTSWTGGINLRPKPNVVLKAEISLAQFDGRGSTGFGSDLSNVGAQAAWAF